jgi:hypothetical protein
MTSSYLEITYRRGKALAGYLYLPREAGDRSERSEKHAAGLVVDYAADGRPIGIEITTPARVTLADINELLVSLDQPTLTEQDLAPLNSAA